MSTDPGYRAGDAERTAGRSGVVAPGFLQNPEVRRWLDGVEPAWTMLEFDSYNALHDEPSAENQTIRLEPSLTETDLAGSAVTRTARILLHRSVDGSGLKLTATGNLSRAVVAEMVEVVEWPGLDKSELFRMNKVINEPDFLPAHFVRMLLQATKLMRRNREKLVPTRLGQERCWRPSSMVPSRPSSSILPSGT